jgi:hypothetical protein
MKNVMSRRSQRWVQNSWDAQKDGSIWTFEILPVILQNFINISIIKNLPQIIHLSQKTNIYAPKSGLSRCVWHLVLLLTLQKAEFFLLYHKNKQRADIYFKNQMMTICARRKCLGLYAHVN